MPFPTEEIEKFVRAGYPILNLVSWEEERVQNTLKTIGVKIHGGLAVNFTYGPVRKGLQTGRGARTGEPVL